MADCKYCGKSAGIFSHSHKECEEKHSQGLVILEGAAKSYFNGKTQLQELARVLAAVKSGNYIKDDDIALISSACIDEWIEGIHRPFHSYQLTSLKDYISCVGVPYDAINASGTLDKVCQKMMKGFIADYFTGQKSLQRAMQISQQIMKALPISRQKEEEVYYDMLGNAGKNFTKDGYLSPSEQQKIDDFMQETGISMQNLPAKFKGTPIEEIGQSSILNALQNGTQSKFRINAPVLLTKGETALWSYNGVTMYQEKVTRHYVGRTGGFSFRIIKGVTYRTGGFKGHPVETSSMENMGVGSLYITDKNIIFMGQQRSIKVPYNKIIGINPYSDGMEVQRDGNNVKRLAFQGFDCSFVLNVISMLNNS